MASPLMALQLTVNWLLRDELAALVERNPHALIGLRAVASFVLVLFATSGIAWLAAEFVTGRKEGPSRL